MQIKVVQPGESRQRFHRRPNFPIAGTMKPFGLYPIMCHPVLPGETLKSAKSKWSVVSQPLVNPLSGAWLESWLFYVKLTDLDRDLGQMFISDTYSTSGWTASITADHLFTKTGGIAWIEKCLLRIEEAYFRNEGEASRVGVMDTGIPSVKMNMMSWYQNLMFEPAEVALNTTGEQDHIEQMSAFQMLQQMQMTELTYEAYLEQYGVQSMKLGIGEPEILRYSRSWTLPSNTIDPTDGTPSSAWVWKDEMKVEKDKRFDEPGFVIMLATVRPKMFQFHVQYSMIQNMWGFTDWYPAYNLTDPTAGVKRITSVDDVFHALWNASESSEDLLFDYRDLLNHGEAFLNDRGTNAYPTPFSKGMDGQIAALPADTRGEYPLLTDVDALFVNAGADEKHLRVVYDGIVGLTIAGHVRDTTL